MKISLTRTMAIVAAAAALGACPAAGLAATSGQPARAAVAAETNRAIVVEIGVRRVRLRGLDGVVAWRLLAPRAEILLNGRPALLTDLRKGFVAETVLNKRGRVTSLKATGRLPATIELGVVQASDATSVTLRKADGTVTTFPVDAAAVIQIDGAPATLADITWRMRVSLRHRGPDPAFRVDAQRVLVTDRGLVETVSPTGFQLRTPSGALVAVPFAADTVVRIGARLGAVTDVKVGVGAEVQHLTGGPALIIRLPRAA